MADSVEIVNDILELTDTVIEALDHLNKRLLEGHLEESRYLLEDVKDAIASIQNAAELFIPHLGDNQVISLTEEFNEKMEEMTATYEMKQLEKAKVDMQWIVMPLAAKWREELSRCLVAFRIS